MSTLTYFVIIDPTQDQQPAVQQALQMALKTGASLHLFCCDYLTDLNDFPSRRLAKQSVIKQTRKRLTELAKPLLDQNVSVSCEAYWNQDWHRAVLQASSRQGADLIFKTTKPHSKIKRAFSKTSDILLLRLANCPVLLTKTGSPWQNNRILAAVAIESDDDSAHDQLNNKIIAEAQRLAKHTGAELHLVAAINTNQPLAELLQLSPDDEPQSGEDAVAERFGVAAANIHLQQGDAKTVIKQVAERLQPDLLILGTVARQGLRGLVVGNTAERVLDELSVDLLTIN